MILLPARQVRLLRWFSALNGLLLVACIGALLYTLPRSLAYSRVLEENLVLKERLDDIDAKMSEVDRILLRLRLYDAQLRSLSPDGDHGPVSLPDVVDASGEDAQGEPLPEVTPPVDGEAEAEVTDEGPGLRDASSWADGLVDRVTTVLDRVARSEPNLSDLVVQLEDLKDLERALPKRWPTGGSLTSGYGWRRNPVGRRGYKFHSGLDIANARGTPIFATADGLVAKATYNSGYGRQVVIDHGYGITTSYSHCHVLLVKAGQRVREGQRIATMGNTGRSTGPHLHYEVHLDGNAVDPMDYVPRGRTR
ncbi:MAG: M23 family metallopeptidase [Alphaproteobacteria bacterium]|nr:M23 family metallopeptidase [Alphaproteobacteria bacterium]